MGGKRLPEQRHSLACGVREKTLGGASRTGTNVLGASRALDAAQLQMRSSKMAGGMLLRLAQGGGPNSLLSPTLSRKATAVWGGMGRLLAQFSPM